MPNTFYHSGESTPNIEKLLNKVKYLVKNAKRMDVYHYHGSWFEYTWEIEAENLEDGSVFKGKLETSTDYKSLIGKIISHSDGYFKVIEEVVISQWS